MRRSRRALGAALAAGVIGLAGVGCSASGGGAGRSDPFDRAVRDGVHRAWVADAERAFEASGVGGTPSVLVDGEALDGGDGLYDAGEFGMLLDGALGS